MKVLQSQNIKFEDTYIKKCNNGSNRSYPIVLLPIYRVLLTLLIALEGCCSKGGLHKICYCNSIMWNEYLAEMLLISFGGLDYRFCRKVCCMYFHFYCWNKSFILNFKTGAPSFRYVPVLSVLHSKMSCSILDCPLSLHNVWSEGSVDIFPCWFYN